MRGVKDKTVLWRGFIRGASLASGASELPAVQSFSEACHHIGRRLHAGG